MNIQKTMLALGELPRFPVLLACRGLTQAAAVTDSSPPEEEAEPSAVSNLCSL